MERGWASQELNPSYDEAPKGPGAAISLALNSAAVFLPHRPVRLFHGPRIFDGAAALLDEAGQLATNRPEAIWSRSQRDVHVSIVIGGDPVRQSDCRQDGAGQSGGHSVPELCHHRHTHIQSLPGGYSAT